MIRIEEESCTPALAANVKSIIGNDLIQTWLLAIIAASLILVILVQGSAFLVPLAIAALVFSLLTAAIDTITRIRLFGLSPPYWLANIISIAAVAIFILIVVGIVTGQIDAVVGAAPRYAERAQDIASSLLSWLGDDVRIGLANALAEIDVGSNIRWAAGSAGYVLTTLFLILIYVGFLLSERVSMPKKFARLFPDPKRARAIQTVLRAIGRSIRRYILVKTIVSALTGILTYGVLSAIGLDFAETWGLLAFFLNFIPNIGSIIAAILPTLAAMIQFEDWAPVAAILFGLGGLQFTVGNIIEPLLMGRTLNLSSFVIILSLTFWGAVWGIVGMFLAVPIMVMIMIACAHIPPLRPIAILLSADGRPPTEPAPPDQAADQAAADTADYRLSDG